jgi:N,N'-diacetyllegionaminate synthase
MIKIGKKSVGDGCPTFITFEAGATHCGLSNAKELAQVAANSGGDAIKFQIFDPDELISDRSLTYSYDILSDRESGAIERIEEPLYDIFVRRSLSDCEWRELKVHCDELGITFFATIGDEYGLDLVKSLNCDTVKVASSDINYYPFIRKVAKLGVSVQIDSGNATFDEINEAIKVVKECGNEQVIIHNCPSGYPANLSTVHLKSIPNLKTEFGCPIAFSDHTPGDTMSIAAICFGANMIEKTITINRATRSVEHIMSLEPADVSRFVRNIRDLERAFGDSTPQLTTSQSAQARKLRRSLILDQDVVKGQKLHEVKVKFKRPGFGISPHDYEEMVEMCFKNDLAAGSIVLREDLG